VILILSLLSHFLVVVQSYTKSGSQFNYQSTNSGRSRDQNKLSISLQNRKQVVRDLSLFVPDQTKANVLFTTLPLILRHRLDIPKWRSQSQPNNQMVCRCPTCIISSSSSIPNGSAISHQNTANKTARPHRQVRSSAPIFDMDEEAHQLQRSRLYNRYD